jgi:hypothetical protein
VGTGRDVHATLLYEQTVTLSSPTSSGHTVRIAHLRTKSHGRMASSWMLRRVALVRTDVSEELSASIISAIGYQGISSQRVSVAS